MPRVPVVDGPQLRSTALGGARVRAVASEEAFGGGRANEGIDRALNQTVDIFQREAEKANELAVLEADTKAVRHKNSLFYDEKSGAMTRKGKDAIAAVGEYTDQWDKSTKEIEESLSNPAQRRAFRARAEGHKTELNGQLQKHAFMESQNYDTEQTQARVAVAQEEAVLNYKDPFIVGRNLQVQEAEIKKHAERLGLPPEKAQLMLQESKSKTHSQIIERMLVSGNDLEADAYAKSNKDQFTGQDSLRVEKLLEDGSLRGGSQRFTDDVMKRGLTMSQALEEAKSIENPKLRDAAASRVREEFQIQKIAREDQQTKIFENASNILESAKGDLGRIKPSTWAAMDMNQRQALEQRSRQLKEGTPAATNWDKYYEFKTVASSPELRNDFLRTNLMQHRHELADSEFKELINLQTSLRKGESSEELDGFRQNNEIVNTTLTKLGVDTSPKPGSKDSEKVSLFRREVEKEVIARQKTTGKKISNTEVQEIVDNLAVPGTVPGTGFFGFFQTKKSVYEWKNEGGNIAVAVKDIPRAERLKIEDALRKANKPATEDAVTDLYNAKLTKMMGK